MGSVVRKGATPDGDATIIEGAIAEMAELDSGGRAAKDVVFRAHKDRYPQLADSVEHLVIEFRERLITHLPPLDPGAARLLDALDDAGLPWGIVSNGSPTQIHKVRALGLHGRARCVVISEKVGMRKPAPEIFHLAAHEVGADPTEVIFVGDHPEADILGASGAGMLTAWLRRGRVWPESLIGREPHYAVDSLEELRWIAESTAG